MILTGALHEAPEPINQLTGRLQLMADTVANASRSTARLRRNVRVLNVIREVMTLNTDQVWALFYVRGGQDPAYAEPDAVDDYLRVLHGVPGERGAAARTAFLHGWAQHRAAPDADPVVWHRYIGDTAIQVHPEPEL